MYKLVLYKEKISLQEAKIKSNFSENLLYTKRLLNFIGKLIYLQVKFLKMNKGKSVNPLAIFIRSNPIKYKFLVSLTSLLRYTETSINMFNTRPIKKIIARIDPAISCFSHFSFSFKFPNVKLLLSVTLSINIITEFNRNYFKIVKFYFSNSKVKKRMTFFRKNTFSFEDWVRNYHKFNLYLKILNKIYRIYKP